MAEIGAVASIIGIIGAGTKVTTLLFDLASAIGSAGQELQHVASEISFFCLALGDVQSIIGSPDSSHLTPAAVTLIERILQESRLLIDDIDAIVRAVWSPQGLTDIPSLEWINKVKWQFKKSKVQVLRQTLESYKSTLHLFLSTVKWGQQLSEKRPITDQTLVQDEQNQIVTQSLVMAQQYSVAQLSRLEDVAREEEEEDGEATFPGTSKSYNRASRLVSSLTSKSKPQQQHSQLNKRPRASIWLDELVFGDDQTFDPHPGVRQKRLSSVSTAKEPIHLLQRWTDHRLQRHYSVGLTDPTLWDNSSFSFPAPNEGTGNPTEDHPNSTNGQASSPKAMITTRNNTFQISPKTSMISKPNLSVSTAIGLPPIDEIPNLPNDLSEITYDSWMNLVLKELGLAFEPQIYELVIIYASKVRVIATSEKPQMIFEQLNAVGVEPQFVFRRMAGIVPKDTHYPLLLPDGHLQAEPADDLA